MQLSRGHSNHGGQERNPRCLDLVDDHHEGVFAGRGERQVEDKHCRRLQLYHPGRGLVDLHHAGLFERYVAGGIDQPHAQLVVAQFGAAPAEVENEMGAWMHGWKLLDGNVSPDAEHGEFPLLVNERIVAEEGESDLRTQLTRMVRTTSPCCMAFTTFMPCVTCPKTVCTRSRCDCGV